jgi:hypothetical protein
VLVVDVDVIAQIVVFVAGRRVRQVSSSLVVDVHDNPARMIG